MDIFNTLLINPIINILLLFFFVLSAWNIPGAFGLAVIALTSSIRLAFQPFYGKQMETSRKLAEIKPEVDKLTEKYKNDKTKLQQEQLKLYQKHGINPASGCLVAILQIPFFIALYHVLRMFLEHGGLDTVADKVNQLVYFDFLKISHIDPWLFGFNLGVSPSQFREHGYQYLLIPLITAALQYFQVKLQTPPMPEPKEKKVVKKGDKPEAEDFQTVMQKQMKIMFPLMIGYFSYILPVGLALYWNVFSIISILQGKSQWKNKTKSKK